MQVIRKTKQDVVAEFRSAEILNAARRVFARKGFEAASVDEIAEAAGLAKGTVYIYFRSKRDLYLAALQQGIAGLMDETRHDVEAAQTAAEKIRAFLLARIRYAEANPDFVRVCQAGFGAVRPCGLNREFKSLCQRQVQVLERVIEEGSARGEIRPVPAAAAAFLVCEMGRALIGRRLMGWSRASAEEDVDSLFELIWKGLAGPCDRTSPGEGSCIVH